MSRLNKKHNMKVAAAALAGCIFLAGGTGTAYAANVGGIQRTVQVWLHGDQTTANMTVSDDGTYTIEYPDENGETREISGGGIAYEADGTERPLTGEELLELAPNVRLIQDDNTQDSLLNGEASVAFLYTSQVTAALQENPDLKVVYPEEGLGFGVMGMFIPSQAPDKDEAYQFMDTFFSRKMQQNVSIISDTTAQTKQQIPCLRIRTL